MLTDLMREMLPVFATEGDYGFLMAADQFDDSADTNNRAFGRILRNYVNIQTYVRMSQPIPLEMASEMEADNRLFVNEARRRIIGTYNAAYDVQLGPFFLRLTANMEEIASNLSWLEVQPVRQLAVNLCYTGTDFDMILRNHRMDYVTEATFRIGYRNRPKPIDIATAVSAMKASCLNRLTLTGCTDPLGLIRTMFQSNRTVPKGAQLFIGSTRVHTKM